MNDDLISRKVAIQLFEANENIPTQSVRSLINALPAANTSAMGAVVKPLMFGNQGDPLIATQEDGVEYTLLDEGDWWSWKDNLGTISRGFGSQAAAMNGAETFDSNRLNACIEPPTHSAQLAAAFKNRPLGGGGVGVSAQIGAGGTPLSAQSAVATVGSKLAALLQHIHPENLHGETAAARAWLAGGDA